jgi:glycosyltransferase involved in cell wall biosynthesis
MNDILLSICIPTFNRSYVLDKSINSIVSQKEFNECIELVISDNCSDDDTFEVVQAFQKKYSNIKYIRNENNIGPEKNIFNVLCQGEGKFLKLVNDYCIFNPGSLRHIINILTVYEKNHSVIFFSNNRFKFQLDTTECNNFDEFISKASFSITWIQYFGIWKREFDLIMKGTFKEYNFPHLDLLLRNLELGFNPVIYNFPIITNQAIPTQGGYNLFETFIQNYLILIGQHVGKNQISELTFYKEKKKLLHEFVYPWYCMVVIDKSKNFNFLINGFAKYMIKYYSIWDILIFTLKAFIYTVKRLIIRIFKTIMPKKLTEKEDIQIIPF